MWRIIDIYLGVLTMAIAFFLFAKIVLKRKEKVTKIKLILSIIMFSILYTIVYLSFTGTLKTAVIFFLNFLFFKYVFDLKNPKAIFLTFIYIILLMIPDAIELVAATKIFGMSTEYYYNEFAGTFLCSLIVCLLFLGITIMFRTPLHKLISINIENTKLLIIYMVLTFLCIAVFFYNAFSNIELSIELIASIFVILVFLIILFSLIKQTIENNKLTNEYDKLLEFMITYENEIENQRILRHEIKNEFRTIRAKINDKQNNKEIIEYIDEIVNDKYEMDKEKYAKFGY